MDTDQHRQHSAARASAGFVPRGLVRGLLIGVGLFNALSAVGGGIGLLTPGSMGVPLSLIANTAFTSYLWPAVILILVIGGTHTAAAVTELRRARAASFWAAFAGFALIIWIFVELAIMGGYSILHGIYFCTGVAQLILVFVLLDVLPGIVRGASPRSARTFG
jgi:hypothetical protein